MPSSVVLWTLFGGGGACDQSTVCVPEVEIVIQTRYQSKSVEMPRENDQHILSEITNDSGSRICSYMCHSLLGTTVILILIALDLALLIRWSTMVTICVRSALILWRIFILPTPCILIHFVWFSEWATIVSLNSIKRLVFIMKDSVYFLWGTNWICKYYLEEIYASTDRKSIGPCRSRVEELWNEVESVSPRLCPFASQKCWCALLGAAMCACLSWE
jgi:hypothetical protein